MPNITLSVSEELKNKMNELSDINWSETMRAFLSEKIKRALLLKKLDKMLESSKLTEEDCLKLGNKMKEGMWKRYKKEGMDKILSKSELTKKDAEKIGNKIKRGIAKKHGLKV